MLAACRSASPTLGKGLPGVAVKAPVFTNLKIFLVFKIIMKKKEFYKLFMNSLSNINLPDIKKKPKRSQKISDLITQEKADHKYR